LDTPRDKHDYTYRSSGAKYSGEWVGGFRDGIGKMVWKDGAIYVGEWKYGHAWGEGKFTHAMGDSF
jgi:hypothetical protein